MGELVTGTAILGSFKAHDLKDALDAIEGVLSASERGKQILAKAPAKATSSNPLGELIDLAAVLCEQVTGKPIALPKAPEARKAFNGTKPAEKPAEKPAQSQAPRRPFTGASLAAAEAGARGGYITTAAPTAAASAAPKREPSPAEVYGAMQKMLAEEKNPRRKAELGAAVRGKSSCALWKPQTKVTYGRN